MFGQESYTEMFFSELFQQCKRTVYPDRDLNRFGEAVVTTVMILESMILVPLAVTLDTIISFKNIQDVERIVIAN